ncbi:MAG: hypothetical protein WBA50_14695, partial [Mycobacterium sp.]
MNRRIILSAGGVTAGLLSTTFLPATVAFADNGVGAAGNVGSTAIPVDLASNVAGTGATGALGDAGALGPDASTPTPAPLGDLGALTPTAGTPSPPTLGDTGAIPPIAGTPDATPAGAPDATTSDVTPGTGDGFTIGDTTFNPVQADGSEGFTPLSPLFSAPPLFQVGEGDQSFDVSSGTGSGATDLGTVTASENVTNLFGGIHNTQFTITDVDPASGATASDLPAVGTVYDVATASDLPAVGTVYDVMNFGNGFENVYTDIPGADGAANSITDTLSTPFGDFNIPTDFDAAGLLDPGEAFGMSAMGADAAGGAADAASAAAGSAADAAGG